MNFYQVHYTDPGKLKKRFGLQHELESRYDLQYPINIEREYKRLGSDLQLDFDKWAEAFIVDAITALHSGNPIPELPVYSPQIDIEARMAALSALLTRFSIRQWRLAVKRTLGIDINIDYYKSMLAIYMREWALEQEELVRQKIEEIREELNTVLCEEPEINDAGAPELIPIVETADKTRSSTNTAISFFAVNAVGVAYSDIIEQLCRDAEVGKYKWITRPYASKAGTRPDHAKLHGTKHKWDTPPVINLKTGETGNPGDDYNCHCIASPIFPNPFLAGAILSNITASVERRLRRR